MTEKERIEELTRDIIETQYCFDAKNYYRFENIAKALIEKGYTKNKLPRRLGSYIRSERNETYRYKRRRS